jgi:beta-mannosidase
VTGVRSPAVDLGGTWRAAVADEALRRRFAEPELDDDGWEALAVPGHWRSTPAFAGSDGPLVQRRRFEADALAAGERAWLVLDGVFYQGDVWLDGAYVGDTEGYFVRHTFEVTEALRARREHLLAVEVTCHPQDDRTAKRNLTGVFQHWDCLDPDWNPGGIWRPVRVETTGAVRARSLRVLCREAGDDVAVVALRAEVDSDAARTICLRTRIGGHEETVERPVASGTNVVEWATAVQRPALWWPHALGDQPLHDLTVAVEVDGTASHVLERRIGLRSIAFKRWTMSVNGERLFLKGSNQGPSRMALAEAPAHELARDVDLAVETGLDLLRIHAHVTRPEVYERADEAGLLLWQDMPLQWGYARSIRREAVRQAAAAVDLLGHHPSVAIWCGHNEPFGVDVAPGFDIDTKTGVRFAVQQQLPTWNKTVLDRSVKRSLEKADGTRPVIAHSGVLPHAGSGGTDSHLYFGWYHGHERDLPGFARALPRMVRFVSELGAQAVPETDGFVEPGRWPDLDWGRLARTHGMQPHLFDRHLGPAASFPTYDVWKRATQRYQATVVKHQVEALRRLKYRPTGGFAHFAFGDGHPAVTWAVLDHERVPKEGWHALREACRPVIVVCERPPEEVAPGDALALDVHVVSDLRVPLQGEVTATVSWTGGAHTWRWAGDVAADACARVGTLQLLVPDEPGPLTIDLSLDTGEVRATNRYEASVSALPGTPN